MFLDGRSQLKLLLSLSRSQLLSLTIKTSALTSKTSAFLPSLLCLSRQSALLLYLSKYQLYCCPSQDISFTAVPLKISALLHVVLDRTMSVSNCVAKAKKFSSSPPPPPPSCRSLSCSTTYICFEHCVAHNYYVLWFWVNEALWKGAFSS